ncbi:hypothetical protein NQ315_007611 [Exocentrus adspersus]|uniref:C2H2-type domain-containing protein n=1 Tax=Exocentrus adspersus TaxID=1586481 RepID=A0AAV8W8Q8_9CUCU|nr:hypothetical protein NQ315_007611 [Exocentrus adspersus]
MNSGVAVLSCTDCSGSSTASSDITDPGSPFSTASSHSEDSGSQPAKMPPTQTAHHPPWPWTAEEAPPPKRSLEEKTMTAFSKRFKSTEESKRKQSPPCLNASPLLIPAKTQPFVKLALADTSPIDKLVNNNNCTVRKDKLDNPKMQQGKITEYFKSQVKSNGIKKDLINFVKQNDVKKLAANKCVSLVDQQTQFNSLKAQNIRKDGKIIPTVSKKGAQSKAKKVTSVTVPRKILPAPSNISEKMTINEQLTNIAKFAPTVTLTALSFPPNYTYLQTKAPKPADSPIFVPQFATLANDKIPIPIINRTPCLNVIQPVQKLATINNFNCVKLNATVVPLMKVNALPSRIGGSPTLSGVAGLTGITSVSSTSGIAIGAPNLTLSVETAVPTVLSAKPKLNQSSITANVAATATTTNFETPKQPVTPNSVTSLVENVQSQCRTEERYRTEECSTTTPELFRDEELSRAHKTSPTPTDSDSGISNKECLEVSVSENAVIEQQKSPILSQPKTIRFPAKQHRKDEGKSPQQSNDGRCRWAECNSRFDTSGALLEHLQVKHVISQASQEHYVCLWLGCKVHGRTSCSRSWLERHVLAHAGTKPFRCIVDGCGQRFNSQLMLERHVNGHFNSDGSPNGSAKKSTENGPSKLFKRNGKRIRFRRQPWSARMFDFIDSGIMEGLQHNLLLVTQKRTLGKISDVGDTLHLQSQILAKRVETDGSVKFLLRWHPSDVIPDEWVHEKEYQPTKVVSIPSLQASAKTALKPSLFPEDDGQPRQKQRRKPVSKHT